MTELYFPLSLVDIPLETISSNVSFSELAFSFRDQEFARDIQIVANDALFLRERAPLVSQLVKNLLSMQETPVQFLGREDLLGKG